jgi:bla regulator protein BlaR1
MNTLDSLFEWVLAATLRASALAVVILGIQFVLRRRLPAPWRHALWLPMLLVLILPMLPKMPFGILPAREAAAPMAIEATASSALPVAEKAAPAPVVERASLTVTGYIAIAWLTGACLMLGAGVAGYRRNLKRIKSGARSPDKKLAETLREATREVGLDAAPRVLMSPAVESPAVTGLIRPLLLLPASFPRGFSDAEARLILLHELTHVKRRDLPVNWLICVLQSMHWFNPLLWFAFARMREDREAACDAQVLSLGQTDRRSDYGHALLKLQSSAPATGLSLGFVGIFERSANLRSRIQEISTHRESHPAWRAAGVALIGVLTLVGATQAQERQPRREANTTQNGKAKDPRQVALEKKLDAIVIPVLSFEDVTLEEAVDFLRLRSVELDKTTEDAAQKGVNFIIKTTSPKAKVAALALKDVSLRKAIENVAEAAGLSMVVNPFAVTLMSREDAEQFEKREKLLQSKAMTAASKIIIPVVDFEDTSLKEAVDFLNQRAGEIAEDGKSPKIELGTSEKGEARIQEMRLRNVPVSEVLRYLSETSKVSLSADDEVIRFGK